jgi:hypothetical protein
MTAAVTPASIPKASKTVGKRTVPKMRLMPVIAISPVVRKKNGESRTFGERRQAANFL